MALYFLLNWEQLLEHKDNIEQFIKKAKNDRSYTNPNEIDKVLSKMDNIVQNLHQKMANGTLAHIADSKELLNNFAQLANELIDLRKNYGPKACGQIASIMRAKEKSTQDVEQPKQDEQYAAEVKSPSPSK